MSLFKFFKQESKDGRSPEQIIRRIIEYMPDFYVGLQPFKNSVEFVERHELHLAAKSLIELADKTGHYFSEDFWSGLADATALLKMHKESKYCQGQIIRNKERNRMGNIIWLDNYKN
jgi:hypothetical protein